MSSAAGPRAEGTDGTDYKYREKRRAMKDANYVAQQFSASVMYKYMIKRTLLFHGMFGTAAFATAFMVGFNSLYLWQALWIALFPSCFIGFKALFTNNRSYMWFYRLVLIFVSIPCVIWGISATLGYVPHLEFHGLVGLSKPRRFLMPDNNYVIYFLGLTTLLSHSYSLMCIGKVLKAWDVTDRKNKTQ